MDVAGFRDFLEPLICFLPELQDGVPLWDILSLNALHTMSIQSLETVEEALPRAPSQGQLVLQELKNRVRAAVNFLSLQQITKLPRETVRLRDGSTNKAPVKQG